MLTVVYDYRVAKKPYNETTSVFGKFEPELSFEMVQASKCAESNGSPLSVKSRTLNVFRFLNI